MDQKLGDSSPYVQPVSPLGERVKAQHCLLDSHNQVDIGGKALGAMVLSSGKEHLWESRGATEIDTVVIHYISAENVTPSAPFSLESVLGIFCSCGVSSHYLISRRGKVFLLVPEEMRAWHAGPSIMPAPDNRLKVNDFSLGIELMATSRSGFTDSQYRSLGRLCADIERRRGRVMTYVGHDQIAGTRAVELGLRSMPKEDPGLLFDWARFGAMLGACRFREGRG